MKTPRITSLTTPTAIAALVLLSFALRVLFLNTEGLWRDEVDAIRFALEPLSQVLGRFREPEFNGPLYHLMLRGWLGAAGVNDFALRYLSAMFGVLLVPMMFILARRLGGGAPTAVITALSPALVWYAGEGKMYSMQPFTLALAMYALLRAVNARGKMRWWIVFVIATLSSLGLHILSPLFLAVAAVTLLIHVPRWGRRQLLTLGAFALPLAVLAPRAFALAEQFLAGRDFGHSRYGLDVIAQTLASNWVLGLDAAAPWLGAVDAGPFVQALHWLIVIAFLGLAAFGAVADRRWRTAATLTTWLLLPTALLYLISLRVPLFQPRYMLWCAPALYVLADLGLRALQRTRLARLPTTVIIAVIVLALTGGVVSQWQRPIRPQVREAVQHIGRALQPGDGVVLQIPYMVHSWDYYMRNDPRAALATTIEGPYTNAGMSESDVDVQFAGLQDVHTRVWLLESEAALWDQRSLMRSWLDANWRLQERIEWRGAVVSLYVSAAAPETSRH
jgi:4-amino-4-deoxy-L-arabinose transferase-like glycosyltransferase